MTAPARSLALALAAIAGLAIFTMTLVLAALRARPAAIHVAPRPHAR